MSHATRSQTPGVVSTFWSDTRGGGQWLTPDEVVPRIVSLIEIGPDCLSLKPVCQKMGRGSRQVGASLERPRFVLTSCVPPPGCSSSHSHLAAAAVHYVALHWHRLAGAGLRPLSTELVCAECAA